MKYSNLVNAAAIVGANAIVAKRGSGESICDYYTQALTGGNTAADQELVLTLVVNTAVIGNYSSMNVGVAVPGILTPGTYMGQKVNLLPYFDGALDSTNMGGSCGVSVNFLDGGGAAPLEMNKPADNTSSNQYTLLTHLYEYFASLLGCSVYGNTVSPYAGDPSMYEVHKFMALDQYEVGYFIENVGLSAASFGVSAADVKAVGDALVEYFDYRCEPAVSIPPFEPAELQSICQACSCPVAPSGADCGAYGPVIQPEWAHKASGSCGPGQTCPS